MASPGSIVLATSTWNEGTAEMLRSHEQAKKVQVGLESAGQAGSYPRAQNYNKGRGGKGNPLPLGTRHTHMVVCVLFT